jgi:hypothetical protein
MGWATFWAICSQTHLVTLPHIRTEREGRHVIWHSRDAAKKKQVDPLNPLHHDLLVFLDAFLSTLMAHLGTNGCVHSQLEEQHPSRK